MESIGEYKTTPIPGWLQIRYGQLWEKFGHTEFTLVQAVDTLKEPKEIVNVILSRLRKNGWLTVGFDQGDFRRRIYHLVEPTSIFRNIEEVKKEHAQNTEN